MEKITDQPKPSPKETCRQQASRTGNMKFPPNEAVTIGTLGGASMGYFSIDRTTKDYAEDIWKIKPVPIVF